MSVPLNVAVGCCFSSIVVGAVVGSLVWPLIRTNVHDAKISSVDESAEPDLTGDIDSDEDSDVVPPRTELKLILLVREDLKMSKGKIAAQVGHAVLACYRAALRRADWREWVKAWLFRAQAKISLKVESEHMMDEICAAAIAAGLPCEVIEDAGRTEVAPGTRTVAGIGPCPRELVDRITGPKGLHPLRLLA